MEREQPNPYIEDGSFRIDKNLKPISYCVWQRECEQPYPKIEEGTRIAYTICDKDSLAVYNRYLRSHNRRKVSEAMVNYWDERKSAI